jgi:hypothetical protein
VISGERLRHFEDWLEEKGDNPNALLTLRWITEFEEYTEKDEETIRQVKDWLKANGNDPEAAIALSVIAWAEGMLEDEELLEDVERLRQFEDWLKAKGNDPNAILALWWIAEFEEDGDKDRAHYPRKFSSVRRRLKSPSPK